VWAASGAGSDVIVDRCGVVLLHVLPLDSRMWRSESWIPFDFMAPNLYALGDSIEEWAASILSTVGPADVVAVGCSVGGYCALELARQAPDQVRGIILVGTKPEVRPEPAKRDAAVRILETQGVATALSCGLPCHASRRRRGEGSTSQNR
jgi:pimeloyl-ACP methyl ester carboxylesterase